jgi:hypothetical protein
MIADGRRWIRTAGARGGGAILGAVETGAEAAVYGLAGTRAERRGRVLSLARCARERQVAGGRVGPGPIPTELGSVLFKWVGQSQRAGLFGLFLLITSFPINSKAPVSKIQITILLKSNTFQIWQVDR